MLAQRSDVEKCNAQFIKPFSFDLFANSIEI